MRWPRPGSGRVYSLYAGHLQELIDAVRAHDVVPIHAFLASNSTQFTPGVFRGRRSRWKGVGARSGPICPLHSPWLECWRRSSYEVTSQALGWSRASESRSLWYYPEIRINRDVTEGASRCAKLSTKNSRAPTAIAQGYTIRTAGRPSPEMVQ